MSPTPNTKVVPTIGEPDRQRWYPRVFARITTRS